MFSIFVLLFTDAWGFRDCILLHSSFALIPTDFQDYHILQSSQQLKTIPKETTHLLVFKYNNNVESFVLAKPYYTNLETLIFSSNCFIECGLNVSINSNSLYMML